jgi:isoleucyl-tRNA synthetase
MSQSPFPAVAAQPDLAAQEHRTLDFWRERATFTKLRAQNAGGEHWSFVDGPITANNPMGVHHAWGRSYKDAFCRVVLRRTIEWCPRQASSRRATMPLDGPH